MAELLDCNGLGCYQTDEFLTEVKEYLDGGRLKHPWSQITRQTLQLTQQSVVFLNHDGLQILFNVDQDDVRNTVYLLFIEFPVYLSKKLVKCQPDLQYFVSKKLFDSSQTDQLITIQIVNQILKQFQYAYRAIRYVVNGLHDVPCLLIDLLGILS